MQVHPNPNKAVVRLTEQLLEAMISYRKILVRNFSLMLSLNVSMFFCHFQRGVPLDRRECRHYVRIANKRKRLIEMYQEGVIGMWHFIEEMGACSLKVSIIFLLMIMMIMIIF